MANRKLFPQSVAPLPDTGNLAPHGLMVQAAEPDHGAEQMTLLFSLGPPPETHAELEARVARGETIPENELRTKYAPAPADVTALEDWLKNQGFTVDGRAADDSGVYATASVDQIAKSLQVNMVRVTRRGVTHNAAQGAPSLPADVGNAVSGIVGLQPFRQANKHSFRLTAHAAAQAGRPPYHIVDILRAYDAQAVDVTGKDQTIAILIDTFPTDADVSGFWQANNVAVDLTRISKINVRGGPLPAPEGEETLDVSWASGIAPGAAIRVYASGSLRFVDLDMALDRIIADADELPGLRQLSISLGLGETFMPPDEVNAQHDKFVRLAARGVNVFVSSGDAGSNPDSSGHNATGPLQAEHAASDPFVIGVGGTSLSLSANGAVSDEMGWSSSGGGRSVFFKRPAWQTGNGVPPGAERLVPDVSATADPNLGAFLIINTQPTQIGGTSWSAPVWAGFCALMNEARNAAGKAPLGFLNPVLYPLIGTACFRDITDGSNGAFNVGTGYDLVTGIGVPNVGRLIQALTQ
jgi:kumamolisin